LRSGSPSDLRSGSPSDLRSGSPSDLRSGSPSFKPGLRLFGPSLAKKEMRNIALLWLSVALVVAVDPPPRSLIADAISRIIGDSTACSAQWLMFSVFPAKSVAADCAETSGTLGNLHLRAPLTASRDSRAAAAVPHDDREGRGLVNRSGPSQQFQVRRPMAYSRHGLYRRHPGATALPVASYSLRISFGAWLRSTRKLLESYSKNRLWISGLGLCIQGPLCLAFPDFDKMGNKNILYANIFPILYDGHICIKMWWYC
jgi:hypothetical protein